MNKLTVRCCPLISAVALLFGCGGSQPPIGAPGARLQTETHEGAKSVLLYLVTDNNYFDVIDYADGKLVQTVKFADSGTGGGVCSGDRGHVFVTANIGNPTPSALIFEYAHGGKTPIATLNDGNSFTLLGCSIDTTTGNLAAINSGDYGNCAGTGDIAVFPGGQGPPTTYTDSSFECYRVVAYDSEGNLFVGGKGFGSSQPFELAELPKGSSTFVNVTLSQQISCVTECMDGLQWAGRYVTVIKPSCITKCYDSSQSVNESLRLGASRKRHKSPIAYRIAVSGSTGTIVGTSTFRGKWTSYSGLVSLINEGRIIFESHSGALSIWNYPSGSFDKSLIKGLGFRFMGLALSK